MKMPTPATERGREAGFTLLELLAVLTILAISAGAFVFNGGKAGESAKFRAVLMETAAAIKAARNDAMRRRAPVVFTVDAGRRRIGYAGGKGMIAVPQGVELAAVLADSVADSSGAGGIAFYPEGTSSGGVLVFSMAGRAHEIRVNWLTGNVSQHAK